MTIVLLAGEKERFFNPITSGVFTPESCVTLGKLLALSSIGKRIGIATDGKLMSKAVAHAFISGAILGGAHIFNFGNSFYTELEYLVQYFSLQIGVQICFAHGKVYLQFCGETEWIEKQNFKHNLKGHILLPKERLEMHELTDIGGIDALYGKELMHQSGCMLHKISVNICSSNERLKLLFEDVFSELGGKHGDEISIKFNASGTRVSMFHRDCGWIPQDKLLAIGYLYDLNNLGDVYLPIDAPKIYNTLSIHTPYKLVRCESTEQNVLLNRYQYDGLCLALKILGISKQRKVDLPKLLSEIPTFFIHEKIEKFPYGDLKVSQYENEKGTVQIFPYENGEKIRILAEASSYEIACDLCTETEEKLRKTLREKQSRNGGNN